jgi:hypothetical protein
MRVRVEHVEDAVGIGERRPRLSWWLPRGATEQRGYELRRDDGVTSGRVGSAENVLVEWPGEPLSSRERRAVRARVWTDLGESGWSGETVVETGLLEPNLTAVIVNMRFDGSMVFPPAPDLYLGHRLLEAHGRAREVLRSVSGLRAGFTVAAFDFHDTAETGDTARRLRHDAQDLWFDAAKGDDFVGVQAYSRILLGAGGPLPTPADAESTLTGWEYYPAALGEMVRRAHDRSGVPVLVTENGIATDDDRRRIDYTSAALDGLGAAIADGVDVRGYLHWSLLDNFEWVEGYRPTFGLVAVDRQTFARTPKPSLAWLGKFASEMDGQ